jgi:hypothetical protein
MRMRWRKGGEEEEGKGRGGLPRVDVFSLQMATLK